MTWRQLEVRLQRSQKEKLDNLHIWNDRRVITMDISIFGSYHVRRFRQKYLCIIVRHTRLQMHQSAIVWWPQVTENAELWALLCMLPFLYLDVRLDYMHHLNKLVSRAQTPISFHLFLWRLYSESKILHKWILWSDWIHWHPAVQSPSPAAAMKAGLHHSTRPTLWPLTV